MRKILIGICILCSAVLGAQELTLDPARLQAAVGIFAEGSNEERAAAIAGLESLGTTPRDFGVIYRVLEAFKLGELYVWNGRAVLSAKITEDENYVKQIYPIDLVTRDYLEAEDFSVSMNRVQVLSANRTDRTAIGDAQLFLQLRTDDRAGVLNAVRRITTAGEAEAARPVLEELAAGSPYPEVAFAAKESLAILDLAPAASPAARQQAVHTLSKLQSLRGLPLLETLQTQAVPPYPGAEADLAAAVDRIRSYQNWAKIFDILKSAVSTGSILILMALGLAITFGMMGVINMAHGEMMMIGAYTTYCVQLAFGHSPESPVPGFFWAALPASFLAAALVGGFIEWAVVRRLYRKPFESLLATYGVSLILVQVIRLIFGDNRATNSPSWLQGAAELAQGMSMPTNRIFILGAAVLAVLAVWAIFRYTRLGLDMRATMQNRDMAAAMGINTRKVDSFTFMLGSGIAGIAGYALTTIGGITPDMGKNYIVDSFLIVVTGGVGSLAGVVSAGAGIGFLNKLLEGTVFGTVWAKIIVLTLVMTFIQFKPAGLFAPKGRLADE